MFRFLKTLFFGTYKVGKHHEKHTIRPDWRDDPNVLRDYRHF